MILKDDLAAVENAQNTRGDTVVMAQGLPWWLSGKESSCNAGDTGDVGSILDWEGLLEEGMATHSSSLAWRITRTEEPGGLQSVGVTKSQTGLNTHAGTARPLFTAAAASSFTVPSAVGMNLFPSIFAVTFFRFL